MWSTRCIATALLFGFANAGLPDNYPSVPIKGVRGTVRMPLYGIGTWQYNNTLTRSAVSMAFKMGFRHVDTALLYGNQVGVSEALAESGVAREMYFVTTKVPPGLNATATEQSLDTCLERLGLKYVDLMLLHLPDPISGTGGAELRKKTWTTLEKWALSGKARAIGVSHYCQQQYEDILSVATLPVAVNQVQYHVGMGSAGPKATDDKTFFDSAGVLYQSFSPLCGPCTPPDNKELITGRLVTEIGTAHNKTGPQVALRWLVQQGIPVIPKTHKADHMKENMDIFDFKLTQQEMAQLTAATSPAVGGGPGPDDSGDCSMADIVV